MANCSSGKKPYQSESLAEEALIEARTRYDFATGTGPQAVYACGDCGQFHLTSRGPMNKRLAMMLAGGHIEKQKEADRWLEKLKTRN